MFGFGKKRENLSINPDNHPEVPAKEGAKVERSMEGRSSKEIGAELNRQAVESVKGGATRLMESGKNLWGGLKRIMGSAKEGGKEAWGQAKTWAKEGAKDALDISVGGAYKGAKAVGRGVERGAAFVANAPEMALEKTADVLEAGADWTKSKLEQGGQWADAKYEKLSGWAGQKSVEIQGMARDAKEGFVKKVDSAREWGSNQKAAFKQSMEGGKKYLLRLEAQLLSARLEKIKLELENDANGALDLRSEVAA